MVRVLLMGLMGAQAGCFARTLYIDDGGRSDLDQTGGDNGTDALIPGDSYSGDPWAGDAWPGDGAGGDRASGDVGSGDAAPAFNSLSLDLDDDDILVLTRTLDLLPSGTLAIWFKVSAGTPNPFSSFDAESYIWMPNQTTVTIQGSSPGGSQSWAVSWSLGVWNHLVITRDAGMVRVWMNGVESTTGPQSLLDPIWVEQIGAFGTTGGDKLIGNIDEAAHWQDALSGTSVAALYNGCAPTDLNVPSGAYGVADVMALTDWWRMGDGPEMGAGLLITSATPGGAPLGMVYMDPTTDYEADVP